MAQVPLKKITPLPKASAPVGQAAKEGTVPVYDSTYNIKSNMDVPRYRSFVGQEVSFYSYIKDNDGYSYFYDTKGKRYRAVGTGSWPQTPVNEINGRTFRIVAFDEEKGGRFTLVDRDKPDTLLWGVDIMDAQPIVTGFYEKMKRVRVGRLYKYIWDDQRRNRGVDLETGEWVSRSGVWTCEDMRIQEDEYGYMLGYILGNDKGHKVFVSSGSMDGMYEDAETAWRRERAEKQQKADEREALVRQHGESVASAILKKQVRIGMTTEQCILAIGRPEDITRTVGDGYNMELWVYDSGKKILHFDNGKLTMIQTN